VDIFAHFVVKILIRILNAFKIRMFLDFYHEYMKT